MAVAAADVVLVELDQRTHSSAGGTRGTPASTCLFSGWEILTSKKMPLGLLISPVAANAHPSARRGSLDIGHYYKGERAGGRAVGRASFPGESKDCDDCLEAKWSQQSEQQTPESNNNSERLR